MITIRLINTLINTFIASYGYRWQELLKSTLRNFQIYNAVLLTIITMLFIVCHPKKIPIKRGYWWLTGLKLKNRAYQLGLCKTMCPRRPLHQVVCPWSQTVHLHCVPAS